MVSHSGDLNLKTDAPVRMHNAPLYNRALHLAYELRSGRIYLDMHYPVDSGVLAQEVVAMKFETRELTRGLIEILTNIHEAANTASVNAEAGYYQVISSIVQTMFCSGHFVMEESNEFDYGNSNRTMYEKLVRNWYVDFMRLARENSKNGDDGLFAFRLQLTQEAGEFAMKMRERIQEIHAAAVVALKKRP